MGLAERSSAASASSQLAEETAEVAHELMNALGVVLANAQLARLGHPEDPMHDRLIEIEQAATDAVELVRQLSSSAARAMSADQTTSPEHAEDVPK